MKERIIVTGGAGFIGSEFVRLIVERKTFQEILVIDNLSYAGDSKRLEKVNSKISFFKADITEIEEIEKIFNSNSIDFIIHFAAESHVDKSIDNPSPFINTNIIGTQNLLDLARKYNIKKFVNISTDEVYGDLGVKGSFTESSILKPSSPYSVSKASADMLGRAYMRTYGLPIITVRPSNNYGPWQFPEKLIPLTILNALNNLPIKVYSKGENIREWIFVQDCANALLEILLKGKIGEIYNLGSSVEKNNLEVVKFILNKLDRPESLIEFIEDRAGHDFRYSLNSNKIKKELGWETKISFEEGLSRTIDWYVQNMDWGNEKN